MNSHILVCPYSEKLISKLKGRALVVRTNKFQDISHVYYMVNRDNKLHCVLIKSKDSLSSIAFQEDWKDIPIALYVSGLGSFRGMVNKLPVLKQLNIRVFISADKKKNFTDLRILSSLGVPCGLVFGEKKVNWDAVNDLMCYAIYGKVPHSPIEPFYFAASNYNPNKYVDLRSVYFENPKRYLHVNEEEHIFLSSQELIDGHYIENRLAMLDSITQNDEYKKRLNLWQTFFLESDGCAYCQGWRVCLGMFSSQSKENPGCKSFFSDLMDAADYFHSMENIKGELWQP